MQLNQAQNGALWDFADFMLENMSAAALGFKRTLNKSWISQGL